MKIKKELRLLGKALSRIESRLIDIESKVNVLYNDKHFLDDISAIPSITFDTTFSRKVIF